MRTSLLTLLALTLLLGPAHAGAATDTSAVDCPDADGREALTVDGLAVTIEAPAPYPSLSAPVDTATPGAPIQPYRRAQFPFQADFAPAARGDVTVTLDWTDWHNDYDVFIYDADGVEIGRAAEDNVANETAGETALLVGVRHCDVLDVHVTNFSGAPTEPIDVEISVTPKDSLACLDGDTAPGCTGKAAGEAPEPTATHSELLYLGGDVGQAAMAHDYVGNGFPYQATLSPQRPLGAQPNSYTAPPVGFNDYKNPFQAFFSLASDEARPIKGDVTALVWISSPTLKEGGTLEVDLYLDGASTGRVQIDGTTIREYPTPVLIRFEDVDYGAWDVTLQLGTQPVASTGGTTGDPNDAVFTVWYDSVQFPSRITLP